MGGGGGYLYFYYINALSFFLAGAIMSLPTSVVISLLINPPFKDLNVF